MANILDGNSCNGKSFHSFAPDMIATDNTTRIRQKAHEMMLRYGIRNVSMDDIAGALGISKKTIYQHFSDKDELVLDVISNSLEHKQACCLKDSQLAKDAIHEVFLAIQQMQEMMESMNPVVIHDLERFHPKAFSAFLKHKHEFIYSNLVANLKRGIEEELYRPEIDIEILVRARLEIMMLAFNQDVFPKNKFRLIDVEMQLTDHFLYGIATPKGVKLIQRYKQERLKTKQS